MNHYEKRTMADSQYIQEIFNLLNNYEKKDQAEKQECLSLATKLNEMINQSNNKPQYSINILDILNVHEPLTSLLFSMILNYRNHNDYALCRSFIEHFLVPCGFDMKWYDSPQITAETNHVDVCIQEKRKYSIIIENKLKGAVFQRNQIARYIGRMREDGFRDDRIFIIIIPNKIEKSLFNHVNKSVWRLPKDWWKPNQERECAYQDLISCKCDFNLSCDGCKGCEKDLREEFVSRTMILDNELLDWLEKSCIPNIPLEEQVLISTILQFIDFINGIYNNRFNDKLIMEIEQFLREELLKDQTSALDQWKVVEEKITEVEQLTQSLQNLKNSIGKEIINEWKKQLTILGWNVKDYDDNECHGFYIDIRGIKCGCWKDNNNESPYWGFRCKEISDEQRGIIHSILEETETTTDEKPTGDWIAWNYDLDAGERCETFFRAALRLHYLG